MATPTDVNYSAGVAPAISAAWLNGISDWVNGWYGAGTGVLGSTYTAFAARQGLGLAVGTYTTAALGAAGTDARTVAHGLGTDNIDFGFVIVGDDAAVANKYTLAGMMMDANGNVVSIGDCFSGGFGFPNGFTALPSAGNLSFRIQTSAAQALTVKWWARKRA